MLPMRGAIAAGIPTDSQETADELFPVPATRAVAEDDYLLRVRGDSMIEAHIEDGDVVVVRPATSARPGEIVAALVDGESTVKYLAEKDGRLVLRPANPRYSDIVPSDELVIQGRVVSVTRNLY
jgi:repressor LexA